MREPLRVPISCETRGVKRRAFASRAMTFGHETFSLLRMAPTAASFAMCVIASSLSAGICWRSYNPPCMRLCRSGRSLVSGSGVWPSPTQLPKGQLWDDMKAAFMSVGGGWRGDLREQGNGHRP